jgi:hypothetical protein
VKRMLPFKCFSVMRVKAAVRCKRGNCPLSLGTKSLAHRPGHKELVFEKQVLASMMVVMASRELCYPPVMLLQTKAKPSGHHIQLSHTVDLGRTGPIEEPTPRLRRGGLSRCTDLLSRDRQGKTA